MSSELPTFASIDAGIADQGEPDRQFRDDLIALIPQMRAFARSLTGNRAAADDLAQEAMMRAWKAHRSFTPGTNMKGWTFMIVRNQFRSDRRRAWRTQSIDPGVAERTLVGADDPSGRLEVHDLRRAMLSLSEEQREALTLVGAAGLSYDETAAICQVAAGTIKSRVSRARAAVRSLLADGDLASSDVAPDQAAEAILRDARTLASGRVGQRSAPDGDCGCGARAKRPPRRIHAAPEHDHISMTVDRRDRERSSAA